MSFFDDNELADLDGIIKDVEQASPHNNAELVKRLAGFSIKLKGDLSAILATDPQSTAYIEKIKEVHEEIIGKRHSRDLEGLPGLNLEYEFNWPYPWGTQCAETVGRFLISYGFIIRSADLPRGARVLEVGCGMGSLTWNLARMGYRVDAIDPNPEQCAGVRAFTRGFPAPPDVYALTLDEWLAQRDKADKYDAVIFFESFHHLMDHQACLRALLGDHMRPDGKVILAAEPIMPGTSDILPYPWGPRLDGESLRAMRNWGWLELGYTERYLRELFHELGLGFQWFRSAAAAPHSELVIGSRATFGVVDLGDVIDRYPAKLADGIDFTKDGLPDFIVRISGLSHWEDWGRWTEGDVLKIEFNRPLPSAFTLTLHLAQVFGSNLHETLRVRVGEQVQHARLKSPLSTQQYRFHFEEIESNVMEMLIPRPGRPCDAPDLNNNDARELGIGIRRISLEEGIFEKPKNFWGRLLSKD